MIKIKIGFYELEVNKMVFYFLEEDQKKFGAALCKGVEAVEYLYKAACLVTDKDGYPAKKKWSHVTDKDKLISQVQRIRQEKRDVD